jgi:4-hydroxyphenylacetate 3-monooxygenase
MGCCVRTGDDYLESLDDGRQVWIGSEKIDDIRTHPATKAVVAEHARYYDRHSDPEWAPKLMSKDDPSVPIAFKQPKTAEDLTDLVTASRAQAEPSVGNITHPPGYGALIMLGCYDPVLSHGDGSRNDIVESYYRKLLAEQRFMAAPYVSTITDRFRPPPEKLRPAVVKERDDGIIVRGMVGLGTGMAYANELFTAPLPGPMTPEQALWFAFPVGSPGVKVLGRVPSARSDDPFLSPLSTRYDETDATVILEDVFVPWESVFVYRDIDFAVAHLNEHVTWLVLHHLTRMHARAEFSLGLALAVADGLATTQNPGVVETLMDLVIWSETIRTALDASAAIPQLTGAGSAMPNQMHLATGTMYALQKRAWAAETVRTLAGFGGMLAPTAENLADPEIGEHLTASYGGGNWTARQRSALLHLLRDHTASAMDAREAAFEMLASAGMHTWRLRTRMGFGRYEELANRALEQIADENPPTVKFPMLDQLDPLFK